MAIDNEGLLLELYKEQAASVRHHETQRSTVVNFILLIGGAIIGIISNDENINRYDLPLSVLLIVLGLFGVVFSMANTLRNYKNKKRGLAFLQQLDNLIAVKDQNYISVLSLKRDADTKTENSHKLLTKLFKEGNEIWKRCFNVHLLWIVLPCIIALIGIYFTVLIFTK